MSLLQHHYPKVCYLRVLGVLETLGQASSPADTSNTSQTRVKVQPLDQQQALKALIQVELPLEAPIVEIPLVVAFSDNEKHRYERCRKMNAPKFQGGKTKVVYEVLTTCRELLDVVGLAETYSMQ